MPKVIQRGFWIKVYQRFCTAELASMTRKGGDWRCWSWLWTCTLAPIAFWQCPIKLSHKNTPFSMALCEQTTSQDYQDLPSKDISIYFLDKPSVILTVLLFPCVQSSSMEQPGQRRTYGDICGSGSASKVDFLVGYCRAQNELAKDIGGDVKQFSTMHRC